MIKIKIILNYIALILSFYFFIHVNAQEFQDKDNIIIEGELDLKTSEFIKKELEELKKNDEQLKSDIYLLQDSLISKNKDKVDLNIYVSTENKSDMPNYGIIQLTGSMNNIPLIRYDHPLIFEKTETYPLFEGAIPLGEYRFKINAIVGQQLEKWPFVLPEGKWSIEKIININAQTAGDKKNFNIMLKADEKTGIPQFELVSEDTKK